MTLLGLRPSSRPALIEGETGSHWTYREVIETGTEIVAPIGSSKQALFLLSRNDAFSATTYAGALLAGHAVAFLDADGTLEMLAGVISLYRPPWLAGPSHTGEALAEAGIPVESVISMVPGELVRTAYRVDDPSRASPNAVHPDLSVMLGTSGTTGSRKFVRLSSSNLHRNAASIAECLSLCGDERPITSLPLHYSFGLSVLNSHWVVGAAVVLTNESVIQRPFWDMFVARGCTSLAGVPFTYQLLERAGFRNLDLPSLRTLQQAGGALDARLTRTYADYMTARGGRFYVMYGQTEATARISYVPPDRLLEKLGSAGIPIPGGRLHVDAGPADGESGRRPAEIVYEGPNVMMGYATGPEDLRLGDEMHGVLRTGDIGYLDEDGFLFLVGRSKRITKVFGLRINLDEFETALREHGPAAVVGGDDVIWGFCEFGTDESVAQLARTLARRFKLHHATIRLKHVEAIPTTAFGKTDYQQVQRWIPA
jgi:acyl-CoA synthetase (AMP-forming)/AMP-acid ligase II